MAVANRRSPIAKAIAFAMAVALANRKFANRKANRKSQLADRNDNRQSQIAMATLFVIPQIHNFKSQVAMETPHIAHCNCNGIRIRESSWQQNGQSQFAMAMAIAHRN